MPKSRTVATPAVAISVASATSSEIEKRSIPGIESISSRTSSPATTKRGWIKSAGLRFVSRTRPRKASVRRKRRMRVAGNGTGGEFKGGARAPLSGRAAYAALECPERGALAPLLKPWLTMRFPWVDSFRRYGGGERDERGRA